MSEHLRRKFEMGAKVLVSASGGWHRDALGTIVDGPEPIQTLQGVFEGAKGAIADRIVWSSKAGALRGNEEYAKTEIAAGMQRIVASYNNFFGTPVTF